MRKTVCFSASLLFPFLVWAQGYRLEPDRLVVEPEHWESWDFPQGTVTVAEDGVRPVWIQPRNNAIPGATIVATGSNPAGAPNILDNDPATYWEPDIDSPQDDWWIEIDLGKSVNATQIALRFIAEDEGDPFYQFNLLIANGMPAFSGSKVLAFNRIGRTEQPNTSQRLFAFDVNPLRPADKHFLGDPVRFLMIQMTDSRRDKAEQVGSERYERLPGDQKGAIEYYLREASGRERLVDFDQYQGLAEELKGPIKYYRREQPRLADVEVWTAGDNLSLEILDRGGKLEGFGSLGSEVLTADGDFMTTWDTPSAYADPVDDSERNFFIDLGAMFWLNRIQLIYQVTQASGPFPNYVASLSDGSRAPDGSLVWIPVAAKGVGAFNTIGYYAGDEPITEYQSVLFPVTRARFFRLDYLVQVFPGCSGLGCSASMREIQFYGEGFLPEVALSSELIELGTRPRTLSTIAWDADIPEGTQLQVRTRTGNQLDQQIHYFNKSGTEVTEAQYRKLLSFQRGDSLITLIPGADWSNWSQFYEMSGTPVTSPSPRRFLKVQAALVTGRLDQAVSLRELRIDLDDPLASQLVGEISPGRIAETGREQTFTLYLRPFFQQGDPGFDQLLITSRHGAQLSLLDLHIGPEDAHQNGTAQRLDPEDLPLIDTEPDSLWLALPETIALPETGLIALRFTTVLFSTSNVFDVSAGLKEGEEIVWQRADGGNTTDLGDGSALSVLAPFVEKIIRDVQVFPNPFTPNQDGVNETLVLGFSVFKISVEKTLFLEVYNLSGKSMRRIEKIAPRPVGQQQLEWDGRDGNGDLVVPRLYICRFGLKVDTESDRGTTATRLVSVAY